MKKIAVFGSTGSIGKNTLAVARHLSDTIKVTAIAAHSSLEELIPQIDEFHPEIVAVFDEKKANELRLLRPSVKVVSGEEGLLEMAAHSSSELLVVAMSGLSALKPTLAAIELGKTIGLANKEILVSAGALLMSLAKKMNTLLLPIDSEHNAIFQCLEGKPIKDVNRLILTASGGPFRSYTAEQLKTVTLKDALCHPTWNMGRKITVDSSTLMNKGLEVIEAHFLFNVPPEKIEVVIHPQSIVHSFVEFVDGSILAQMSEPHMTFPIQYALTYPKRLKGLFPPFDFNKHSKLEFFAPDSKFPALSYCYDALKQKGSALGYLNAANEVLVERFLKDEISWLDITRKLERLLACHKVVTTDSVETIIAVDKEARQQAQTA